MQAEKGEESTKMSRTPASPFRGKVSRLAVTNEGDSFLCNTPSSVAFGATLPREGESK